MGKNSNIPNKIINPTLKAVLTPPPSTNWVTVIKEMSLKELIELKLRTVTKIKSISAEILNNSKLSEENIKARIKVIEGLQYNLTIFKQLNAIANVGDPDNMTFGINAHIYRSSDLQTLKSIYSKLAYRLFEKDKPSSKFKTYLDTQVKNCKEKIEDIYFKQANYNKSMRIRVEYLAIPL